MFTVEQKLQAVELASKTSCRKVANLYKVSHLTIWRWQKQLEGTLEDLYTFVNESKRKERDVGLTNDDLKNLPDDPEELKRIIRDLTFEYNVKEEVLKIVKKDLGVDLMSLPNSIKAQMVDALRKVRPFSTGWMMSYVGLAPATFYYHVNKIKKDKEKILRAIVKEMCAKHPGWGYRRIKFAIENDPDAPKNVSEKRIIKIMKEEGLQINRRRSSSRYNSYDKRKDNDNGIPNVPLQADGTHNFGATKPNELWVTDVTEFCLPTGQKIYLSSVLDCYDSSIRGWEIALSSKAEALTNPSLAKAVKSLTREDNCIIHSDRGGHYFSEEWIKICVDCGLQRSMSRKGHSPDNARIEGFFGRLKMEFYDTNDWEGVSVEDFCEQLNDWIIYYNEERPKESFGWKAPMEYRKDYLKAA